MKYKLYSPFNTKMYSKIRRSVSNKKTKDDINPRFSILYENIRYRGDRIWSKAGNISKDNITPNILPVFKAPKNL
jgi:hypothetical protein